MTKVRQTLLLIIALFCALPAHAQFLRGYRARAMHVRTLGLYASAMGDPFPSLYGMNVMLTMTTFSRLHAGYGYTPATNGTATSYGGGLQLYIPRWAITPVIGAAWARVNNMAYGVDVKYDGVFSQPIGSFGSSSASHVYYTGGLEVKLFKQKVLVGGGFKKSLKATVGGAYYVQLGYFF